MKILRVVGALLAVGVAAAGCGYVAASRPAPATTPAASGTTPDPVPAPTALPRQDLAAGSDGLTVRYADRDGSVKTLRVGDFRR